MMRKFLFAICTAIVSSLAIASTHTTQPAHADRVNYTIRARNASGDPAANFDVLIVGPIGSPFRVSKHQTAANGEVVISLPGPGRYHATTMHAQLGEIDHFTIDTSFKSMSHDVRTTKTSIRCLARFYNRDTSEAVTRGSAIPLGKDVPRFTMGEELGVFFPSKSGSLSQEFRMEIPGYRNTNLRTWISNDRRLSLNFLQVTVEPVKKLIVPGVQDITKLKLDGMIRMINRDRIVVGNTSTISVNLVYSGGTNLKSAGAATVEIKDPNGNRVYVDTYSTPLPLNEYAEKRIDIKPKMAGKYTVTVNATGEGKSKWTGEFSFVANSK